MRRRFQAKPIVVGAAPVAPVAAFTGTPVSGTVPFAVQFTSTSTGSPISYAWTFGDGGTATTASPSHSYTTAGTYTVALTVTNAVGSDTQTRTGYVSAAAAQVTPVSLFTTQTPTSPDVNDGAGIALSTRFTSSIDGNITGVRFYRAATAPTSVVGLLYTDAGVELARATYGTLTTGWNSVTFATPVAITAGSYYRAAYWTSAPYVATAGIFASPFTNANLTGTDGSYIYSATPAFPSAYGGGGGYFADVLFVAAGSGPASTTDLYADTYTDAY